MAFYGKVAVVTGSASGMGQIAARRLADAGATVAAVDVNEEGLAETAASSPNIHPYRCDVSSLDDVRATIRQIEADLGPIDRLTHAAAIMPAGLLADMPAELINKQMLINYCGTVNMVKTVLEPMLERRKGDIIMFGSMAGDVLTSHLGAYCATKSATNSFGEILIEELRNSGLRILLVCPPMVNTPLIKQALVDHGFESLQSSTKTGRMADPQKIIDAIEEGIEKGKQIVRPAEAAFMVRWRRFAPRLLWKMIHKANQD